MKKFSTITRNLALKSLIALSIGVSAGIISASVSTSAFAAKRSAQCTFLPNAPDQHVVVKGDTLWGISGLFLEHAWCWPEVWGMNRQEIKNPHWIYPGQVIYLDRAAGRLRLGRPLGRGNDAPGGLPTIRLSPQIRAENIKNDAITTIPASVIEPFLSQPLVLEESEFKDTPHIVAAGQGHVNMAKSEKAYAVGDLHDLTNFQVYRPSTPLIDPVTKKILGYESVYVGTLKLTRAGKTPDEAHSFLVTNAKEEMTVGDHLLPVPNMEMTNYVPHPPADPVNGHIVSIYGGVAQAGQNQTVSINLGLKDGMDIGTVLKLYRLGEIVDDRAADKKEKSSVKLPDEEYGTLFVYRVFNNVSYGLIMSVSDSAQIGDIVRNPE